MDQIAIAPQREIQMDEKADDKGVPTHLELLEQNKDDGVHVSNAVNAGISRRMWMIFG